MAFLSVYVHCVLLKESNNLFESESGLLGSSRLLKQTKSQGTVKWMEDHGDLILIDFLYILFYFFGQVELLFKSIQVRKRCC